MGDATTESGRLPYESAGAGSSQDADFNRTAPSNISGYPPNDPRASGNSAFYSQYSSLPRLRTDHQRPPDSSMQSSTFSMDSMSAALPEVHGTSGQIISPPLQQAQRGLSGASTPALVYQMQQLSQYPGQSPGAYGSPSPLHQPGYPQGQMQTPYFQNISGLSPGQQTSQRAPMPHLPQSFSSFSPQSPQYYYYPSQFGSQGASQSFVPQANAQMAAFGRRGSAPHNLAFPGVQPYNTSSYGAMQGPGSQVMSSVGSYTDQSASGISRQSSETSLGSVPRGPPRKPKQSGHALWVGNLPPGTTVIDLKDHFSRDATRDIESLFLISKSNCAFVNYRTEASCAAAMQRFHDSRFHGVRLVCRLRRSSAPASGVPTGPSSMVGSRPPNGSPPTSPKAREEEESDTSVSKPPTEAGQSDEPNPPRVEEKFFIVKSLTLQDLDLSVRNGIWATQSHNETVLNKAFESADNVYLIFSANKSGEYFGYARMLSPIIEDATEIIRELPKPETVESTDSPKTIPTPATEFAPKGRIIDDSARGTIFWEADLSDVEEETREEEEPGTQTGTSWGKPFKIEWLSTNRLPFYRTRGLRNPWNANREVKIARDGTELETSVGKRLVQMFHRLGPSNATGLPPMQMMPQMGGPQIRPYQ